MEIFLNKIELTSGQIIENLEEAVLITNRDGVIQAVNSSFCMVTGYDPEEVIGKNPRILKSGLHNKAFYQKMWRTLLQTGRWQGEIHNRRKNGEVYTEWLTIRSIRDDYKKTVNFFAVFSDITKKKIVENNMKRLAFYDPLTELPNRVLFRDRLSQALVHAKRNKKIVAVLFLDLDGVKEINDTLGHSIGDQMLQSVSRRLKTCLREGDTVGRIGGDEFLLVLPGAGDAGGLIKIAGKILEVVRLPFRISGHNITVTASIGISFYPHDGTAPDLLIKKADAAMYDAKKKGKNQYKLFVPGMRLGTRGSLF